MRLCKYESVLVSTRITRSTPNPETIDFPRELAIAHHFWKWCSRSGLIDTTNGMRQVLVRCVILLSYFEEASWLDLLRSWSTSLIKVQILWQTDSSSIRWEWVYMLAGLIGTMILCEIRLHYHLVGAGHRPDAGIVVSSDHTIPAGQDPSSSINACGPATSLISPFTLTPVIWYRINPLLDTHPQNIVSVIPYLRHLTIY